MQHVDLAGIGEAFVDEILDTVETPIALLGGNGAFLRFNHACERLTEYSEAEAIGQKVWDFLIIDEEIEAVKKVFERTCTEDVSTHYINYWKTKSGHRRLLKWSNKTLRKPDGSVALILATAIDITELKSIEHDLTANQAFLRSIIDASPIAVITIDESARILTLSRQAELTFGCKEEDVLGKNIHIMMPEPDRSRHDGYMDHYMATGEKRIIGRARKVTAQRLNGEKFPAILHVSEFKDRQRVFVGFVEDISEKVETERRLSDTQFQLQHASRVGAMGEIATSIAHELNQPLTAAASLAGAVSLTLKKANDETSGEAIALLDDVVSEIRRASDIIFQMREFIRKRKTAKSLHDVNKIVEDAAALAIIGAEADGIEVKWDLSPETGSMSLDRIQIQQVVTNLIRNAIDAMRGSPRKVLTISTKRIDEDVSVSVADTGPGLADDMKDKLFEPFVSGKDDGMGVGLSISKSIIDAHQGEIGATTLESGGCVFSFILPAGGREDASGFA